MRLNVARTRQYLQSFDFTPLFVELGWNRAPHALRAADAEARGGLRFHRTPVAVLSGIHVFEITVSNGVVPDAKGRAAIHAAVSILAAENLLIFTDAARTQSLWYWVKREDGKAHPRPHLYVKGQPGDLFLSKLASLLVDISELDAKGNIPLTTVARRLKDALDVEGVTKDFYRDFQTQHLAFLDLIEGIPDARDRRWYASVLLNRLMFVWFLQKKGFLDVGKKTDGDREYLPSQFAASERVGKNRFFSHFLRDLFFEGFAKPEEKRAAIGSLPLGDIPYLNGGLFLPHGIETRLEGAALFTGPYSKIRIPDAAFAGLFALFNDFTWSLNDTPGGDDREINPDVLGYIFEKYINQKEFGAYYTRPEITEYLCEQTIQQLVLDAATKWTAAATPLHAAGIIKGPVPSTFDNVGDLLLHADGALCQHLLQDILPKLSLLDPACGSGAFLVAALKMLVNLTAGLVGRCQALGHRAVLQWIEHEQRMHRAPQVYWLKKKIITENLYGVDLMEEAVEIAKLRLFLTLVASAEARDQLEPLPNIEFNLLPGNSLIGLLHVDPAAFDSGRSSKGEQTRVTLTQDTELGLSVESTTAPTSKEAVAAYLAQQRAEKYTALLVEKNRMVALYRISTSATQDLAGLRALIDAQKASARAVLDRQLLNEFQGLGIDYSQAVWDEKKKTEGRPEKRSLTLADIRALHPFHWAYEFDEIIVERGGFDAIITNPPWEILKPNAKEFFLQHSDAVSRKSMRIEDFEEEKSGILAKHADVRSEWLAYLSSFPHLSEWFRCAPQFANQISEVNGRKAGSDINLYKLFTEQTRNLLRDDGRCGIVIPSGIYTDLGATQLRRMLYEQTRITGLFGFENRREIFEGVHRSFKFVVLSFEKGGHTENFPAAFMRHSVSDLASFPSDDSLVLRVDMIARLSPATLSLMEFHSALDIFIAEKLLRHPLLGEERADTWNVGFTAEFHMTNDSDIFDSAPGKNRLPLYEGKMIWQFEHGYAEPRYWVEEKAGRCRVLGRDGDTGQKLGYQDYRLAFRDITASTNERTLVSSIIPPSLFCGNTLPTLTSPHGKDQLLYLQAIFGSFSIDWLIRKKITSHCNFFYMEQIPVPRLTGADPAFRPLVERAIRLIGTTAEFDDLLKEIFGSKATHRTHGERDPAARARLRAELDALVAQLYNLTEEEFAHILTTFPLVDESIKQTTLNTYRDLNRLGKLPSLRS